MSVREYFQNIYDTVHSSLVGMKITLKYCFQKTVTVQYPEQKLSFAPRYRGIHEFEADKCIACDLCAKACPVDCIYIDKSGPRRIDKVTGKVSATDPKNGELLRFAIDYSKCLFCALCTEPCPTDCIQTWASCTIFPDTRAAKSSWNLPNLINRISARPCRSGLSASSKIWRG